MLTALLKSSTEKDWFVILSSTIVMIYCAEEIDNKTNFDKLTLTGKDNYSIQMLPEFLGGVNVVRKKKGNEEFLFIPYYSWANRGVGRMKVWFEQKNF